ncbi:hypothetical protein ACB092_08G128900 [Castanea dentata]
MDMGCLTCFLKTRREKKGGSNKEKKKWTFLRSNNLQLSKNHQLHPINQAAYKFYVGV